ncbi:MAG: PKD domain-containing protein [Planctomycetota bacterium]
MRDDSLRLDGAAGERFGIAMEAVGDLNGDIDGNSREQIVVGSFADYSDDSISNGDGAVRLLKLAGSFDDASNPPRWMAPSPIVPPGGQSYFGSAFAAAGDQNGDGIGDLWVAARDFGRSGDLRTAAVFLHSGSDGRRIGHVVGTFDALRGNAIAASDVTDDGKKDLIVGYDNLDTETGTDVGGFWAYDFTGFGGIGNRDFTAVRIVDAGADITIDEGSSANLGALITIPDGIQSVEYQWTISTDVGVEIPSLSSDRVPFTSPANSRIEHPIIPPDGGKYDAELQVFLTTASGDELSFVDSVEIEVLTVNPIIDLGRPVNVDENMPLFRTVTIVDANPNDLWRVQIDYDGDGIDEQTIEVDGESPTFNLDYNYANFHPAGSYELDVRITERQSNGTFTEPSVIETLPITLTIGAPVVTVVGDVPEADEGVLWDPGTLVMQVDAPQVATLNAVFDWAGQSSQSVAPIWDPAQELWTVSIPAYTFVDNGTYPVTVSVTDGGDQTVVTDFDVVVNNVDPSDVSIDSISPESPLEGDLISFTASASDVSADSLTFEWDFSYSGVFSPDATGASATHTYPDNGSYEVRLRVSDDDGGRTEITETIVVANAAPLVSFGDGLGESALSSEVFAFGRLGISRQSALVNRIAKEGDIVVLNANDSFEDPAGSTDLHTFEWTVIRDGEVVQTGEQATFDFHPDDDGTYQITLTVRDKDGGVGSDLVDYFVTDVAGLVSFSDPGPVSEGQAFTMTVEVDDVGIDDLHDIHWFIRNASGVELISGIGSTIAATLPDDGRYTITASATDTRTGLVSRSSRSLIVDNTAPSIVNVDVDVVVFADSPLRLEGTLSDPGVEDIVSARAVVEIDGVLQSTSLDVSVEDGGHASIRSFADDLVLPAGQHEVRIILDDGADVTEYPLTIDVLPAPSLEAAWSVVGGGDRLELEPRNQVTLTLTGQSFATGTDGVERLSFTVPSGSEDLPLRLDPFTVGVSAGWAIEHSVAGDPLTGTQVAIISLIRQIESAAAPVVTATYDVGASAKAGVVHAVRVLDRSATNTAGNLIPLDASTASIGMSNTAIDDGIVDPSLASDPFLSDLVFATDEDTSLILDPLGNDPVGSLPILEIDAAWLDTTGTLGTVTPIGGGRVRYEPGDAMDHLGAGESTIDRFAYTVRLPDGSSSTSTVHVEVSGLEDPAVAEVVGRHIFYNRSFFDGGGAGNDGTNDDAAIDPTKMALLPGEMAGRINYTGYTRGINGLMIDVQDLTGDPTVDDFVFMVGNSADFTTWKAAPAPDSITVRRGAGLNGSDRIVLTWADGAIAGTWLQVTLKATDQTGLPDEEVHFWGNAPGDTLNDSASAFVNTSDITQVRLNPRNFLNPAAVDDPFDINKDRFVNTTDITQIRLHPTNFLNALRMFRMPQQNNG